MERISKRVSINREARPLHLACKDAEVDTLQALIHHGASANSLDSQRWTPLDHAARQLGAQIHTYLNQKDERSTEDAIPIFERTGETATDLQARLICISMLLDSDVRRRLPPLPTPTQDPRESTGASHSRLSRPGTTFFQLIGVTPKPRYPTSASCIVEPRNDDLIKHCDPL